MRTNFWTGLAGVIVGALLVTALPAIAQDAETNASPGDPFLLGQTNILNGNTALRGDTSSNLVIRNTGSGVPLNLLTNANGKPPMKVDSRRLVRNLNADKLDFKDANDFVQPLYAVVAADGTLTDGEGVVSVSTFPPGEYDVKFSRNVSGCAYTATIGESFAEPAGLIDTANFGGDDVVTVFTQAPDGSPPDLEDRAFHLVVTCGPSTDPKLQSPDPAERASAPTKGSRSP